MIEIPYPVVRQNEDNSTFTLFKNYRAEIPHGYILSIKKGFVTDFASVPKIFWNLINPTTGSHVRAAFVHDYLYATEYLPRDESDDIFLEIMYECGSSWIRRNTMYTAVRSFGWSVWRDHTPESIANNRTLGKITKKIK